MLEHNYPDRVGKIIIIKGEELDHSIIACKETTPLTRTHLMRLCVCVISHSCVCIQAMCVACLVKVGLFTVHEYCHGSPVVLLTYTHTAPVVSEALFGSPVKSAIPHE